MKLSILLRTAENRGDHIADIALAFDIPPGETVERLAFKLLEHARVDDWIEIRRVIEEDQQLVEPAPAGMVIP